MAPTEGEDAAQAEQNDDAPKAPPAKADSAATPKAPTKEGGPPAARPAADGGAFSCGCCCLWTVVLLVVLCGALGAAYALDAPLPWDWVGLGPGGKQLTKATWEDETAGKTVFVKFYASWCGHCKRMKPDWDKLMAQFENHSTTLVADVECTGRGKSLCDEVGVRGYPTIKYGDPNSMSDYKGGRGFAELSQFASKLGPLCGLANLHVCGEAQKAKIEEFRTMSAQKREEHIKEQEQKVSKLEEDFDTYVKDISDRYQKAQTKKDEDLKRIKDEGLGLLKAVAAHEAKKEL